MGVPTEPEFPPPPWSYAAEPPPLTHPVSERRIGHIHGAAIHPNGITGITSGLSDGHVVKVMDTSRGTGDGNDIFGRIEADVKSE